MHNTNKAVVLCMSAAHPEWAVVLLGAELLVLQAFIVTNTLQTIVRLLVATAVRFLCCVSV
jgi:hypothetical protein